MASPFKMDSDVEHIGNMANAILKAIDFFIEAKKQFKMHFFIVLFFFLNIHCTQHPNFFPLNFDEPSKFIKLN